MFGASRCVGSSYLVSLRRQSRNSRDGSRGGGPGGEYSPAAAAATAAALLLDPTAKAAQVSRTITALGTLDTHG